MDNRKDLIELKHTNFINKNSVPVIKRAYLTKSHIHTRARTCVRTHISCRMNIYSHAHARMYQIISAIERGIELSFSHEMADVFTKPQARFARIVFSLKPCIFIHPIQDQS